MHAYKDVKDEKGEHEPVESREPLIDKLSLDEVLAECNYQGQLDLYQVKYENIHDVVDESECAQWGDVEN